jgi:hypothetical protein
MTPALLAPWGLAALAALIVPLAIHIARRSQEQPTDFAALRWLRQKPRPRSQLRFDERLLLAVRLLLLALLALWLAKPVLLGAADRDAYVAVAPGVDPARAGQVGDEPVAGYSRAHWLASGFPALTEATPATPVPFASLLRQLDADLPAKTPLIVVVPQILDGADAERPRLSRRVEWRVVPGAAPAGRATPIAIPGLSVRHDTAHAASLRYLRAAALAWQPAGRDADLEVADIAAPLPPTSRGLVWLGAGSLPPELLAWVEGGGRALIASDALFPQDLKPVAVWRDALGRPLAEAAPIRRGRLVRFTRPLVPSQMPELLDGDFPARLKSLFDRLVAQPTRVAATDYSPTVGATHVDPSPLDLRPWLAVLTGLILLGERWLATRRSRGVSP